MFTYCAQSIKICILGKYVNEYNMLHILQKFISIKCDNFLENKDHVISVPTWSVFNSYLLIKEWASFVDQSVKNLPAVQETWVLSLGLEDPLEKKMAAHSSILVWKISWTEEPGGLQSMGSQRIRHDWATNTYLLTN